MDEIVLAIPSAGTKVTRDILRICNQTECKLKVLPGMYQFITEEVSVSKLREVSIEDLLGRDAIDIDLDSVLGYVKGKTVLVTGGGGSIGSELCRQVAKYNPKCLIIFDIYENNAYDIQQELKKKYPSLLHWVGTSLPMLHITTQGLFRYCVCTMHPDVLWSFLPMPTIRAQILSSVQKKHIKCFGRLISVL